MITRAPASGGRERNRWARNLITVPKSFGGNIYRDDVLLIQFSLDNQHQTVIREPIDVRYVQGDIIGAQFQNAHGMPKPLIVYLRS